MTHSYLLYPGPNPGKLYPSFCAGSLPAHISPLNTGYGGTAALHYRHITPCEHPGGLFAPARPFTYVGVVLQENQQNWDLTLFPGWDRGTPGSCTSYVGTTPLLFRDMLPSWVSRARLTAETGHQRPDMTFRQNDHYSNGFWSNRENLVPFLTLRYDVTRGITPRAQRLSIDHHVVCSGCQGFMGVRPMTSERQPGPAPTPRHAQNTCWARWGYE
jgi:hypothetical protein